MYSLEFTLKCLLFYAMVQPKQARINIHTHGSGFVHFVTENLDLVQSNES